MKSKWIFFAVAVLIMIFSITLVKGRSNSASPQTTKLSSTNGENGQVNPQDVVPGVYDNLIQNTATAEGFIIKDVIVENNVDVNGKDTLDHLEVTLTNTSGTDLTGFEAYYTLTDVVTKSMEGYYKKLDGFVLKNGETQHVNFDNTKEPNHFSVNKNNMFTTSKNQVLVEITVSVPGYKIQTAQVTKDAGGAETAD